MGSLSDEAYRALLNYVYNQHYERLREAEVKMAKSIAKILEVGGSCPCHRNSKATRYIISINKLERRFSCGTSSDFLFYQIGGSLSWHTFDEANYIMGYVESNEYGEVAP